MLWLGVNPAMVTVPARWGEERRADCERGRARSRPAPATMVVRTTHPGTLEVRVPVDVTVTGGTDVLGRRFAATSVGVPATRSDVIEVDTAPGTGEPRFDGGDVGLTIDARGASTRSTCCPTATT